jgi:CRP/FNR family transcriptional regulator, cyclic AMP receptor protein
LDNRSSESGLSTEPATDFFSGLPAERDAFYRIAQHRLLGKKEYLYTEGSPIDSIIYIADGTVLLSLTSIDGRETVINIGSEGLILGLASMAGLPRTSSAQAFTPCSVYITSVSDFKLFVASHPVLYDRIIRQLYVSLNYMVYQYLSAFSDDAETRLKKLFSLLFGERLLLGKQTEANKAAVLEITQEQLGASIGISRSMVSRLLRRMKEAGLIQMSGRKIILLTPDYFLKFLEAVPNPDWLRM